MASSLADALPGMEISVKSSAAGNMSEIASSTYSPPRIPVSQSCERATFILEKYRRTRVAYPTSYRSSFRSCTSRSIRPYSRCSPIVSTIFQPKWDGFRTLIFRDRDELFIQSRDEKPLERYFPELVTPLKTQLPERCVVDGEIVIARDGCLDFEALQLRLHPAASRVKLLAGQIPASVVFFDLLCEGCLLYTSDAA